MEHTNILDYKRLELKKVDSINEDITALLEKTVQGSEGGMRWTIHNISEKAGAYGDSLYFLALYKKSSLMGVVGLCRRKVLNCGREYDSTYLRYLAIQSAFQTAGTPGGRGQRLSHVEEGFKHNLLSMFRGPGHNPEHDHSQPESPHIMYAYIESKNERSKNLIHQAGYEYIRSFLTVAFSRFSPRSDRSVALLATEGQPEMSRLLAGQYADYCFYTDEFSFYRNRYYVKRKGNEIIAGVCAIPAEYRVVNIPGVWGWMIMKVLPATPFFRRLFNPGKFRYLVLGAIYCRKGYEDHLPDLFEAVCAEEGYHTALTWLDDHSELYETLRTNRRMGMLNRMLNAKPGLVYASFSGVTESEKEKFYDNPAYISGFDFS